MSYSNNKQYINVDQIKNEINQYNITINKLELEINKLKLLIKNNQTYLQTNCEHSLKIDRNSNNENTTFYCVKCDMDF
jgi:hypothetical protein